MRFAHFAARAAAGLDDDDVWAQVATLVDAGASGTWTDLDGSELRSLFADLGIEEKFDEQIEVLNGVPLLSPSTNAGAGGFSFLPGGTGATLSLSPVQEIGFVPGMPAYTHVPYLVGCALPDDAADPGFTAGCDATRASVFGDVHAFLAGPGPSTVALTGTVDAVEVAVLWGPSLLPENVPSYGMMDGSRAPEERLAVQAPTAPTWLLRCRAYSTWTGCLAALDADADGYPLDADCDDVDPVRHPGFSGVCP